MPSRSKLHLRNRHLQATRLETELPTFQFRTTELSQLKPRTLRICHHYAAGYGFSPRIQGIDATGHYVSHGVKDSAREAHPREPAFPLPTPPLPAQCGNAAPPPRQQSSNTAESLRHRVREARFVEEGGSAIRAGSYGRQSDYQDRHHCLSIDLRDDGDDLLRQRCVPLLFEGRE